MSREGKTKNEEKVNNTKKENKNKQVVDKKDVRLFSSQNSLAIFIAFMAFIIFLIFRSVFGNAIELSNGFVDFFDKYSLAIIVTFIITTIVVLLIMNEFDKESLVFDVVFFGGIIFTIILLVSMFVTSYSIASKQEVETQKKEVTIQQQILEELDIEYTINKGLIDKVIYPKEDREKYSFKMYDDNIAFVEYRDEKYIFFIDFVKERERVKIERFYESKILNNVSD